MGVTLEKVKQRHRETVPRLVELNKLIRQLYPNYKIKALDRSWTDWDERPINVSSRQRRENRAIGSEYQLKPVEMPEDWTAAVEPDVGPVKLAVAMSGPPPPSYWGEGELAEAMAAAAQEQAEGSGLGWAGRPRAHAPSDMGTISR